MEGFDQLFLGNKKKHPSAPKKKKVAPIKIIITDVDEEEIKRDKEKVKLLKSIADELCQPHRLVRGNNVG